MLLINIVFFLRLDFYSNKFSQFSAILLIVIHSLSRCKHHKTLLSLHQSRSTIPTAVSGKSTVPASEFYSITPQDFRSIPRFSH